MVNYPLKASRCETLAHSLLRFSSGIDASLYCHFNRMPMTKLPFFQIFGDKVCMGLAAFDVFLISSFPFQGEITVEGSFDGGLSYRNTTHPEGVELGSLGGFSAAFIPQMREFVEQIVSSEHKRGEGSEQGSAERALHEVMVAEAAYKSVRTKQWEAVTLDNLT
jgi:predicted dehydrogenase